VNAVRTDIHKLFEAIPEAIWSHGQPVPYVYRGTPTEMVQQMAREMGPGVTVTQAVDTLLKALGRDGRLKLKLKIKGDPPDDIRAGIFVYVLLKNGIAHPLPQA
jgi:hypothetical protein